MYRGILHHFLPKNKQGMFGYYMKNSTWVAIKYPKMPFNQVEPHESCLTQHNFAACYNLLFKQVIAVN